MGLKAHLQTIYKRTWNATLKFKKYHNCLLSIELENQNKDGTTVIDSTTFRITCTDRLPTFV